MKLVCKNHPLRETKRRCFYCREPLCTDCQLTIAHHVFCSKKCHYLSLVRHYFSISQRFLRDHLKIKQLISYRNIIDAILVIGFLTCLILVIDNYRLIKQLKSDRLTYSNLVLSEQKATQPQSILPKDTLAVLSPVSGSMILQNKFDIEGEAVENRIVSLSINGNLAEAVISKGRQFAFKNIIAKPGLNHFIVRSMDEAGNSILLEEIKFYYGKPTFDYLVKDFMRGDIEQKNIAFTFDGGYENNATQEILDILKQENIKATIFLTGIFIKHYPDLVKRMAGEGHIIGNHTWSHPHLTSYAQDQQHRTLSNVTPQFIQQELLRTAELYKSVTGKEMSHLWRAPYGEQNAEIRKWAADAGFRHIGWTVGRNWDEGMDTMDWVADKSSKAYHSADQIADKILSFGNGTKYGANGTIILMHLGTPRTDDYPHQKLPMIIEELKKRGYQFVTISEML
jgi:peptidoglycan/xylan/chitin deacetylase (PgdA/CDA1 family)